MSKTLKPNPFPFPVFPPQLDCNCEATAAFEFLLLKPIIKSCRCRLTNSFILLAALKTETGPHTSYLHLVGDSGIGAGAGAGSPLCLNAT